MLGMDRPNSVFGLSRKLVAQRWNAMSEGKRRWFVVALAGLGVVTVLSVGQMVFGGCCQSSCGMQQQSSGCPYSH